VPLTRISEPPLPAARPHDRVQSLFSWDIFSRKALSGCPLSHLRFG